MSEQDLFERRLADALRTYAKEAAAEVEPLAFIQEIAGARRRRAGLAGRLGWRRVLQPILVWVVVAALLLAATIAAIVGSAMRRDSDPIRSLVSIPGPLHGTWQADLRFDSPVPPSGTYALDFRSTSLVSGPKGSLLVDLGSAVDISPRSDSSSEFSVHIAGACGLGVYDLNHESADRIQFTLRTDPCMTRIEILTRSAWLFGDPLDETLGPFIAGQTYTSGTFTEPFEFVMPIVDATGENVGLPDQFRNASRYVNDGGLRFGGPWWSMYLLDDMAVNADLCVETSTLLPDIPQTPEAVVDWFRTSGLAISEPVAIPVDGRTAFQFDIGEVATVAECSVGRLPPGGYYSYLARAYAIPTGDDTILLVGGSDAVNLDAVKAAMDAFVRSMDFE